MTSVKARRSSISTEQKELPKAKGATVCDIEQCTDTEHKRETKTRRVQHDIGDLLRRHRFAATCVAYLLAILRAPLLGVLQPR
jgi:hypothetical protein